MKKSPLPKYNKKGKVVNQCGAFGNRDNSLLAEWNEYQNKRKYWNEKGGEVNE